MFGRVPFAFYVAHFFLIRVVSIILAAIQGFALIGQFGGLRS